MVHDQAAGAFVPGVRPFDDPALGQGDKALGIGLDGKELALAGMAPATAALVGRMTNDIYPDEMPVPDRLCTLPGITAPSTNKVCSVGYLAAA